MVFTLAGSLGRAHYHLHFYLPGFPLAVCRFVAGMAGWLGIPVQKNKAQNLVLPYSDNPAPVGLGRPSPECGAKLARGKSICNPFKES